MILASLSALDIITDALQKLGVYAPNELPTDADATLGFTQLNHMVHGWIADYIFLYYVVQMAIPLVAQMQDYTIGPGGMVNAARPIRVIRGRAVATVVVGGGVPSPVDSVSAVEWDAIYSPANNVITPVCGTPAALYYEPQNPYGLLSVSPLPAANATLTLPTLYGLAGFDTLTTAYMMAPAQENGLKANLAILLNPYFGGSVVTPELGLLAQQTKTTLLLMNGASRAVWRRAEEPRTRAAALAQ